MCLLPQSTLLWLSQLGTNKNSGQGEVWSLTWTSTPRREVWIVGERGVCQPTAENIFMANGQKKKNTSKEKVTDCCCKRCLEKLSLILSHLLLFDKDVAFCQTQTKKTFKTLLKILSQWLLLFLFISFIIDLILFISLLLNQSGFICGTSQSKTKPKKFTFPSQTFSSVLHGFLWTFQKCLPLFGELSGSCNNSPWTFTDLRGRTHREDGKLSTTFYPCVRDSAVQWRAVQCSALCSDVHLLPVNLRRFIQSFIEW